MSAPKASRRARRGFTLVETILAITILGMGLTALVATMSRCLSVVRRAKNFETARHLLVVVELEHPLQFEKKIEPGSENGDFSGDYSGYRWERAIEVVGREEDGLFSVATRVNWSDQGRTSSEGVTTYLYAPESAKKGAF